MSDMAIRERRISSFPAGVWRERISDKQIYFEAQDLEGLPYWCFDIHHKMFGLADLREVAKVPLTGAGMSTVLEKYGGWEVAFHGGLKTYSAIRDDTAFDFNSWYFRALEIQRAYFLYSSIRRGDVPRWQKRDHGPNSWPWLCPDWPQRLALSTEPNEYVLDAYFVDQDFQDLNVAAKLGKALLGKYIANGLDGVQLNFGYDLDRDSYETDIDSSQVLSLKDACWLILRDLAAGLRGRRFCVACGGNISGKKAGARVCSSRCQKRVERQSHNVEAKVG